MGALHFLHHWLKMTTNNERQSRWIPAYAGMTSKIVSGFALVLSTVSPSSGKTDRGGVVEKPGTGSERVPLVLHGHRIDLTLSSRRRSNATEKRAFVSKACPEPVEGGAPLRCAPDAPGSPSIRRASAPTRDEGECRRGSNASDENERLQTGEGGTATTGLRESFPTDRKRDLEPWIPSGRVCGRMPPL